MLGAAKAALFLRFKAMYNYKLDLSGKAKSTSFSSCPGPDLAEAGCRY